MPDSSGQYTQQELYDALRAADASGDHASAERLSAYIAQQGGNAGLQATASTPQYEGALRLPAMAAQALAQGGAQVAGLPGDLESGLDSGVNWLRGEVTPAEEKSQAAARLPTGDELVSGLHLQGNALMPQNALERYGSTAISALPAVAATVASGGAALPALASGEAGALVGQWAHDLSPDSRWLPVVAGLGVGLGVGGVTSILENAANARNVLNNVTTTEAQAQAAAAKLAQAREDAANGRYDLSTNVDNVRAASKADFAATRGQIGADLAAHNAQQDSAIATVAAGHGTSATLQEAGGHLQDQARNWISNVLPKKLGALWAPVDSAIPKTTQLELPSFTSALGDINKSAGALEPLAGLLKPGLPKALGKALENVGGAKELDPGATSGFSWGDVQKLRTTLGDAMANPKVLNDVGAQNLSRLYATLTSDMRGAAAKVSPEALSAFDAANEGSTRLYGIAEGPISRVVSGARPSAEDPAPEAAARSLLSGGKSGASDLATLRLEIPQGVDELAAAHLRTNPAGFAKLAPEAQSALVPNPDQGATVLSSLVAKDTAKAAASTGVKLAQQTHQANMDLAAKAAKDGNFANAGAVRSASAEHAAAKGAWADAKAQAAALGKPPPSPLGHAGQGMLGSMIGGAAGVVLPHLIGDAGNDLYHGALGEIIGAGAPMIGRGALAMAKNPRKLVAPALGGFAGANALTPQ